MDTCQKYITRYIVKYIYNLTDNWNKLIVNNHKKKITPQILFTHFQDPALQISVTYFWQSSNLQIDNVKMCHLVKFPWNL